MPQFRSRGELQLEALFKFLAEKFNVEFTEVKCDMCLGRHTDPTDFSNMRMCPKCKGDGMFIVATEVVETSEEV